MRHTLLFSLLGAAAATTALTTSCAATRGLGQDLQKVGSKIEDRADATGGAQPPPSTGIYTPPPTRVYVAPPPRTYVAPPSAY